MEHIAATFKEETIVTAQKANLLASYQLVLSATKQWGICTSPKNGNQANIS